MQHHAALPPSKCDEQKVYGVCGRGIVFQKRVVFYKYLDAAKRTGDVPIPVVQRIDVRTVEVEHTAVHLTCAIGGSSPTIAVRRNVRQCPLAVTITRGGEA